ncbi:hydantoinase B/oxoprolinase family protein [Thalassobaculum sp.]|uniref:hydantoinase B/oxoprolinase family protein n=1 Tax=Thalassobaculum sp. TaxID=2022740 RepID=UPI0032F04E1F
MAIFEGSYGSRHGKDGMDAVDTLYASTRTNPIEDIETHLPLRVRRYELRDEAIGAGRWRDPQAVLDDAISAETAARGYGVAIVGSRVDAEATAQLRNG